MAAEGEAVGAHRRRAAPVATVDTVAAAAAGSDPSEARQAGRGRCWGAVGAAGRQDAGGPHLGGVAGRACGGA